MNDADRRRARQLQHNIRKDGMRLTRRGDVVTVSRGKDIAVRGTLYEVEEFLAVHCPPRRVGGQPKPEFATPPSWAPLIEAYLRVLQSGGQSELTMELRRMQLSRFAREMNCPPEEVGTDAVIDWMASNVAFSTETRRGYRAVLRRFFRWAYKTGRVPVNAAEDLPAIREHRGMPRPAPDAVWRAARQNAADDPRVMLILRLAAETGMRRAEIAQASTDDLRESMGGPQLLVHGKGGKKRVVPLSDSLAAIIRACPRGYLFPNGWGGHLSPMWIGDLAKRAMPPGYTLHTLRHRFATRAYRGTRNLRAVQEILGHESVATTQRYTAVDDDEMRAAMVAALTDSE